MRPIRLEMKGFSAFAAPTVVDFAGVELVALIGPTGAGKSSIIDAITFALYGSVARYDERLVAPVINQMAQEARVRFDFEVVGTLFTAVRVARRTKAGGATTKEARLESAGVVLAADAKSVTEQVTRLLGLDFGRFNKTVVLPQGRFAEFLHDKPSARQELLRELLGFGVYERVGRVARERAKAAENRADILEQSVGDGGDISDAHLAAGEATVQAIATLQIEVATAAVELATIETRLDVLGRQGREWSEAISACAAVRVPGGLNALDADLAVATLAEDTCATLWREARRRLHAAGVAQAAGPSASACLLRLRDFAQHRTRTEQHNQMASRRAAAKQRHDVAQAEANARREALQTRRSELAEQLARRSELEDALRLVGDQPSLRAASDAHTRLDLLDQESEVLTRRAATHEADHLAATHRLTEVAKNLAQMEGRMSAAMLASQLRIGDPCPVCGQDVHAVPEPDPTLRDLVTPRTLVEDAQRHALEMGQRTQSAAADVAVCTRERLQLQRRLKDQPSQADAIARLAEHDQVHQQLEQHHQLMRRTEREVAAAESSTQHRAHLAEEVAAAQELVAATALETQSRDDIDLLAAALSEGLSEHDVTEGLGRAEALDAAKAEAEQVEREAADHHAAAQATRARLVDGERVARDRFDLCRTAVAPWIPPKPAGSLAADWQALASWADDRRTSDEQHLNRALDEQQQYRVRRDSLLQRVAGRVAPFVAAPENQIEAIGRALAAAGSSAEHELRQLKKDRQRHAKVQADIATLRTQASIAGILGHQLRTSGFERWLLEEAVADLVGRATVRLHDLTGGQYSLTAEDGAFRIIDHHNADEQRDARSLSGGETFLASLALALALADSALDLSAEGTAPIESIFLDEGFGTLDPDTLEVVAGTIEELGAGGRMVGIVTHIRELADRMPTRLDVRKDAHGSSVTRVDL